MQHHGHISSTPSSGLESPVLLSCLTKLARPAVEYHVYKLNNAPYVLPVAVVKAGWSSIFVSEQSEAGQCVAQVRTDVSVNSLAGTSQQ